MTRFLYILLFLFFFGLPSVSLAEKSSPSGKKSSPHSKIEKAKIHQGAKHGKNHKHDHSSQEAKIKKVSNGEIKISVNGMVCAFCAQGIKKNFEKRKEVKETKVNLDNMEVTLNLHPGKQLKPQVIEEIITGAGFKFVGIKK